QKTAMRFTGDAARYGVIVCHRQGTRGLNRRLCRVGIGEDEPCRPIGKRRFANAGRPADQPGMGNASGLVGREDRGLPFGMAEQRRRRTRVGKCILAAHGAAVSGTGSVLASCGGKRRAVTMSQIASSTASGGWVLSITAQRCGSAAAMARN